MTLIDQYIYDHKDEMSVDELAKKIGVREELIFARIKAIESNKPTNIISITMEEEMYALVQFILINGSGCLVDIAKQRLRDLNNSLYQKSDTKL